MDKICKLVLENKKVIIFIIFVLCGIILDRIFGLSKYFTVENLSKLKVLANENLFLAASIYIILSVLASVVLFLPGVAFAIVAGYLFGAVYGTLFCALAASLGAILSFVIARYFLKDKIKPLILKNKYLKKYLFDDINKNQLYILMITRLIPLFPFNLQNFAYGVTDINFFVYSIGTFIFILPGTAIYTIGAAGFSDVKNRYIYIAISLVLFVAVFVITKLLEKRLDLGKEAKNA